MKNKKIKVAFLTVLILVILVIILFFSLKPTNKIPKVVQIDTSNQPTLGNPNASIHIVAFEDLKCFNCKRFNLNLLPKIKKRYIDTGKAKYTVINLAFIPGSIPVANAARCLYAQNNQLFFDFVKYVYHHQPPEDQNWATVPTLLTFASHIPGVNKKQFETCLVNSPYTELIENNLKIASKLMNPVATPTLYVNGRIVVPLTMKRFEAIVKSINQNR